MLPIIVGVGGLLAITKTRPSTVLALGENAVGAVGKSIARVGKRIGRSAKHFGHDVRIEYNARQLARASKQIEKADIAFKKMSAAEQAQWLADAQNIADRALELRAK